jgi:hypothetical protein
MAAEISEATAKFLGQVMPVIVGTRRRSGAVKMNPAWYEVRDGYLWLNSWRGAHWLDHVERERQAALLFIDPQDMYRVVHVETRLVRTAPDPANRHIDRLSQRYRAEPYQPPRGRAAGHPASPPAAGTPGRDWADSGIVRGVSGHQAVDVARELAERLLAAHGQAAVLAIGLHGAGARRDGHGTVESGATDLEVSVITTSEEAPVPARALRYQGLVIDVAVIPADLYLDEAAQIGPLWPLAADQYLHHQPIYDPTDFFGKLRDAHQAAIASSPPQAFLTAAAFDLAQLAAWEARARADELSGDLPSALLAVKEGAMLAALVVGLVRRTAFRDAGDALKVVATMPDLPDGFTEQYRRLLAPTIDPASAVLALGRVLAALERLGHEQGIPFEAADLDDFV